MSQGNVGKLEQGLEQQQGQLEVGGMCGYTLDEGVWSEVRGVARR